MNKPSITKSNQNPRWLMRRIGADGTVSARPETWALIITMLPSYHNSHDPGLSTTNTIRLRSRPLRIRRYERDSNNRASVSIGARGRHHMSMLAIPDSSLVGHCAALIGG